MDHLYRTVAELQIMSDLDLKIYNMILLVGHLD